MPLRLSHEDMEVFRKMHFARKESEYRDLAATLSASAVIKTQTLLLDNPSLWSFYGCVDKPLLGNSGSQASEQLHWSLDARLGKHLFEGLTFIHATIQVEHTKCAEDNGNYSKSWNQALLKQADCTNEDLKPLFLLITNQGMNLFKKHYNKKHQCTYIAEESYFSLRDNNSLDLVLSVKGIHGFSVGNTTQVVLTMMSFHNGVYRIKSCCNRQEPPCYEYTQFDKFPCR